MKKSVKICILFFIFSNFYLFSKDSQNFNSASLAFIQGTEAYRNGDWFSSIVSLKKALSYPENNNQDTHYMLICAQINAGEFKNAYNEIETFNEKYPESIYKSQILYFKGKVLQNLGEYEKSILILSDFCHQFPDNELYPTALYLIGENFYSTYNYDQAKSIFERFISDFPSHEKVVSAQYKIDSINQRTREEKLLYLLKETGEEYLSAKEEYERQMRIYDSETSEDVRRRMADLQKKNEDLELQYKNLSNEKDNLKNQYEETQKALEDAKNSKISENEIRIQILKRKALETKNLLNQQNDSE